MLVVAVAGAPPPPAPALLLRLFLRLLPPPLGEAGKASVDLLQALLHIGSVTASRVGAEQKIVGHGHVTEQLTSLGHEAEAALDTLLDVEPLKIDAIIDHLAAGMQQTRRSG